MEPNLLHALAKGLKGDPEEHIWDNSKLHVSDLAVAIPGADGKCPRSLWLRLRGRKGDPHGPGKLLMFDHGNQIHNRVGELLRAGLPDEWRIIGLEQKISIEELTGRLDLLLEGPAGRVVVDFKTIRGRAFNYLFEPKPMHTLQVQTYSMAVDADYAKVLYIDREGQNFAQEFPIPRDDAKVIQALEIARAIHRDAMEIDNEDIDAWHGPDILPPNVKRNSNKGPDSIKLELPWQCQYCEYLDNFCGASIPPCSRHNGIVGHIDDEGIFLPKEGCENIAPIIEQYI